MAKISIIVPIYNVEKYLRECLDSIINQTLKDIEIICVNDGSTDSSLDIIKEYAEKDSRVLYIDKQNSGYGASMNMGLDKATGEYIGIVESDDFVNKEMFENLYSIAKNNDCDIVKGDFYHYFTEGDKNKKIFAIPEQISNKVISAKTHPEIMEIYPSIWSAIYKNSFIKSNNIRFLETPGASYQDMGFTFKTFALANKVYLTTTPYVHYRQDNSNSSVNSKSKVFVLCEEYEEIKKFIQSHPEIQDFAWEEMCIDQFVGYRWNTERISEEFRLDFIKKFSEEFNMHKQNGLLKDAFFGKVKKSEFNTLIESPERYHKFINKKIEKDNNKINRRKNFSFRLQKNKIRIVLFGITLFNWEK